MTEDLSKEHQSAVSCLQESWNERFSEESERWKSCFGEIELKVATEKAALNKELLDTKASLEAKLGEARRLERNHCEKLKLCEDTVRLKESELDHKSALFGRFEAELKEATASLAQKNEAMDSIAYQLQEAQVKTDQLLAEHAEVTETRANEAAEREKQLLEQLSLCKEIVRLKEVEVDQKVTLVEQSQSDLSKASVSLEQCLHRAGKAIFDSQRRRIQSILRRIQSSEIKKAWEVWKVSSVATRVQMKVSEIGIRQRKEALTTNLKSAAFVIKRLRNREETCRAVGRWIAFVSQARTDEITTTRLRAEFQNSLECLRNDTRNLLETMRAEHDMEIEELAKVMKKEQESGHERIEALLSKLTLAQSQIRYTESELASSQKLQQHSRIELGIRDSELQAHQKKINALTKRIGGAHKKLLKWGLNPKSIFETEHPKAMEMRENDQEEPGLDMAS